MPSPLKSLAQLFNERVFRIPDYQRGYSWTNPQLEAFWQDMMRLPDGRNHYTGLITLERVSQDRWENWNRDEDTWLISDASCTPFYVVDGQQRLTTAVILIKCLLDLVEDDNSELARTPKHQLIAKYLLRKSGPSRAFIFGYEKDNPSNEFLKTQILGEPSVQYQGTKTVYTGNLLYARDFFRKKLAEVADAESREDIFRRLTQRLVFNEYEIDDDLDVFVTFETMNNRGKELSVLELLKNRLIYLTTLLKKVPQGQQLTVRRNITDAWKTIYEYLGRVQDQPLDDDEFLRAHWIMYFRYARKEANEIRKFLLEREFTPDRAVSGEIGVDDIQRYIESMQNAVRAWHAVNFPCFAPDLSDSLRQRLDRMNRLGRGAFGPLTMTALLKHLPEGDAEIAKLLEREERFVFLVSRLSNRRAYTGDSEFYSLTWQLFHEECRLSTVVKRIMLRETDYFDVERFRSTVNELFKQDKHEGFYSWRGLRYFLFEYELELKGQSETTKINWDEFIRFKKDHVTIEHIYPQSPKVGDWPAFDEYTAQEKWCLTHSLGNLVALSRHKNIALSNRPFREKVRSADGETGYFNGSYSENEIAAYPDWTPRHVLDRGLSLLHFLEERWGEDLGSRDEKVKLLHLDFLNCGEPNGGSQTGHV